MGLGTVRRIGATIVVASAFVSMTPALPAEAATPPRLLQQLINQERTKFGRVALGWNYTLARVALRHSKHMANVNKLHHNEDLTYELRSLPWRVLGENVGVGQSVETLHTAFMNSPPHRKNVLDRRFRKVGVGVYVARGRTWVTVVFYR